MSQKFTEPQLSTWQFMWRLTKWQKRGFWLNFVAWSLYHLLPLSYGVVMKWLFDGLSQRQSVGFNTWTLLAILASAYLGRQLIFLVGFNLFSRYFLRVQAFLRHNLLHYLLTAPGSRILPDSPSESISRFRDDVDDLAVYSESWIDFLGLLIAGLGSVAVMIYVEPLLGVIVCAPLLAMTGLMIKLSPKIRTYRRRMREATARVTDFIGESFSAVLAVKVAGEEKSMATHFRSLGEERKRRAMADVLMTEMIRAANNGLVNLAVGVVLVLTANKLRSGAFSIGDLALFMQSLPRVTTILTFVGDVIAQHRRTKVATDRMERLLVDAPAGTIVDPLPLDLDGELKPFLVPPKQAERLRTLEVRNLTYRYPQSEAGIFDVAFDLEQGDFVVVTGRIGAGKTTLLRCLQGLVPRDSGEVEWNGRLVEDPATFFSPPHSSYTAQVPRLFSESLRHNVMLGTASEERLTSALDLAAMSPDLGSLEKGLDTLVGTRGVKLSGGQVQRTSAARMLARGADLLIVDDLSSALDVATERQLWQSLLSDPSTTCLVVSHRRPALQRATKVLLMEKGRIIAAGPLSELLATQPEMRKIWDDEEDDEAGGS
jgi:ATP-binding cassette, subfamily B, bacterial